MQVTLVACDHDVGERRWTVELISAEGKSVGKTSLVDPFSSELEGELKWYLEEFALRDPLLKRRAGVVRKELRSYGQRLAASLESLLLNASGNYDAGDGEYKIFLTIKDDDSARSLHSLHWELLEQESIWQTESLSITVSRQIDGAWSEHVITNPSPQQPVNVLFVSARPDGDSDRPYRLVSQPIYDLISKHNYPKERFSISFVRPGTWKNFKAALMNPAKRYFIIHFDTHGILKEQRYVRTTVPGNETDDQAEPV
jgi:hypothetical protein